MKQTNLKFLVFWRHLIDTEKKQGYPDRRGMQKL